MSGIRAGTVWFPLCASAPKAATSAAAGWRLTVWGLTVWGPGGCAGCFVGLPVLAGDVGEGGDGTFCGGEEDVGLEAGFCSELAGAGGTVIEA
jgi:hypothetical protein